MPDARPPQPNRPQTAPGQERRLKWVARVLNIVGAPLIVLGVYHPGMKWVARALSIVGLILAGGGFLFGAFLAGAACFDSCPESMSIAAYAAVNTLGYSLPGVLVAGLGWALCLRLLLRADRRWRATLVLAIPLLCALVSVVAVLVNNAGHLFPVNEGEITRWERSLTWPFIFLLAWPLLTFLSTLALPRKAPH